MAKRRAAAGAKKPKKRTSGQARPAAKRMAKPPRAQKSSRRRVSSSSRRAGRGASSRNRSSAERAKSATRRRKKVEETVPTPPSSLNLNRRGSAVRTGRAELAESRQRHAGMTPAITGGDVDADIENAYFSGDEAPGGDNPTPDQDIVDDIGKAIGLEYQDHEELKSGDKLAKRDKHRWELDPASSEDYKDRK